MDIYTFCETPMDCIASVTPCKKKRASCLMRDEIAMSTSACNEFKREMAVMKLKFPFLTESQIHGRTMDKFGIPNIMGKPYKLKSGSLQYSTVNHILYLIKRTITEKKRYRKNSAVRRHTISGAYVPIEIITTKCDLLRNRKSKKNLEKKFSLYSEENDLSDDDYNIESSGEYSRGRYSDILSISEFGYSYQSDGDEILGPYKIRKTYERKPLDKFPTSSYFEQNKKRVSLTNDTHSKKLASDQNVEISKDTASKIDSVDGDSKENNMDFGKQRENDNFKDTVNQKEADHTSGINPFDLSNSNVNKTEENSIKTKDISKEGCRDCNHEAITKKSTSSSKNQQINSVARKRTNSEAKDTFCKQNSDELEHTSDEEMDEIQTIYEKVVVMGVVEVKKEDNCNKIKHSQDKKTVPETSSVLENSQKISSDSKFKTKYIKQSISVCSSEYLWQDGSESSIESSSIKSDSQPTHKYFQRFQRQKISLPFSCMDRSDKMATSQSNTLVDYKSRRNYWRKTSECIILVDLEAQTDSEHNTSVDEHSVKSGENSEENKSLAISHPHDLASENSNDSISNKSDSESSELDDNLKEDGTTSLNVAFSPHFATQNTSSYYSNESLTSQETEIIELNSQRSERSITNELDDDGYYLANLFDDDDNPSTHQRTLRSTSVRENHSGEDEPTFVD